MLYEQIVQREPLDKGWSADKKYRVTAADGQVYLLRISSPEQYERKRVEFERMEQAAKLGIPMCLPVELGVCAEGVYSIQGWVEGNDLEELLPELSPQEQHRYGYEAGQILRKLHTIPAPEDMEPWEERFNRKIDRKIEMYQACPLKYENDEPILNYLAQNRHLLNGRPQTYQHGDYHVGNMMVDKSGGLVIIDFDRDDCGDPWEEFNRIVWCAQKSPLMAKGMVDGYFDGNVPMEFWDLLALYICSNTLSSLPWAIPFGEEEVQVMRKQAAEILGWYDDLRTTVPVWYRMR